MNKHFDINEEITDLSFAYGGIDHKAIYDGFHYFWSNNQVTGFKTDKNGKYVRDEFGNLVAYRTSKARKRPVAWFQSSNLE